ncbi:hypothetical protein Leryth_021335 [Lithospermum erythrorhizon]|nr:hypothetical protein Leryth_021335 [Lithospermum erythrorhizon]
MNRRVPDFELDDVYSLPVSSGLTRKSSMAEDEVMELLWQNGPVVAHTQNQRSNRRTSDHLEAAPPTAASEMGSVVEEAAAAQQEHLFIQEDEMTSWLHYPLHETTFERDISEYFNPPPPSTSVNTTITVAPPLSDELKLSTSIELTVEQQSEKVSLPTIVATKPPVAPPVKQKEVITPPPPQQRVQHFMHFTKLPTTAAAVRLDPRPSSSSKAVPPLTTIDSTVVESNDTPKVSQVGSSRVPEVDEGAGTSTRGRDFTTTNTYDFTLTSSSPGDSSASIAAEANQEERKEAAIGEDRKRKGREADDYEGHSLDTEFECEGEKKTARGSTSTKRSRAAEVHNLSERRRRDRINERMKTLQELIPRCNKTDKASMLDEAIEYLKTLQLQVQMMSMGCGMVPIMFPGVQQYMPAMGMGMGMPMDMSMNRPLVPYPQMLQGSSMPNPPPGAPMAPRFPMQPFHMPVVHDPSRMQAPNTVDPMINPMAAQNPHPNFINPYQQYLGPQQGQVLMPQNQAAVQQSNAKPSTSREDGNAESHQPGG